MTLLLLGIALSLTLVGGSTLKMVTEYTGNVTDQPRASSSFGPFRDVQSVSEYEVHSTTPTITLLKELVNAYDDDAVEYEVKKLEIIGTTIKAIELTTGQPALTTKGLVQAETTTTVSSLTSDVPTTIKVTDVPTTTTIDVKTVPTTTTIQATTTASPSTTIGTTRAIPTRPPSTRPPSTRPPSTRPPSTRPPTTRPPATTTPKRTRTTTVQVPEITTMTPTRKVVVKQPVHLEPRKVPVKGSFHQSCPRPEDIHPCECIEIRSHQNPDQVETVAFCKNIRNSEVLKDAMKGMQGHYINYFVMDSCKMPPFPNGLFQNVGIGWMEMLNSTVQFHENFFSCSSGCW